MIAGLLAADLRSEQAGDFENEEQLQKYVWDTRITFADLNDDGTPEVIAQGFGELVCGATGNCTFWAFRKVKGGYSILVHTSGVQTFTIQRTRTHGFHDLVLASHYSASESGLRWMRIQNGVYREAGCYGAVWWAWQGGELKPLKEPRVTPCK